LSRSLDIVVLGLSITSSWGNGHATTYRGLLREMAALGHRVLFLERDVPWYASNRDLPDMTGVEIQLYKDLEELQEVNTDRVRQADFVIVGSYVPDGCTVGRWVVKVANGATAFYDIDTPVTLAKLARQDHEYLCPDLIPQYDLYLSFSGGPILQTLMKVYGSPRALPLYCSVDPTLYYPEDVAPDWDLAYMGTYSDDRQPTVDRLLTEVARQWPQGRFRVVGPQYPARISWPRNVERQEHLPPAEHRGFYNRQRYTLNVTRRDMIRAGYSPSVRLFEAAACGVPILTDLWEGLSSFFEPGKEILPVETPAEVLRILRDTAEEERLQIAARARERVLAFHTAAFRAQELTSYALDTLNDRPGKVA